VEKWPRGERRVRVSRRRRRGGKALGVEGLESQRQLRTRLSLAISTTHGASRTPNNEQEKDASMGM
jgi:hypothetical protein